MQQPPLPSDARHEGSADAGREGRRGSRKPKPKEQDGGEVSGRGERNNNRGRGRGRGRGGVEQGLDSQGVQGSPAVASQGHNTGDGQGSGRRGGRSSHRGENRGAGGRHSGPQNNHHQSMSIKSSLREKSAGEKCEAGLSLLTVSGGMPMSMSVGSAAGVNSLSEVVSGQEQRTKE